MRNELIVVQEDDLKDSASEKWFNGVLKDKKGLVHFDAVCLLSREEFIEISQVT